MMAERVDREVVGHANGCRLRFGYLGCRAGLTYITPYVEDILFDGEPEAQPGRYRGESIESWLSNGDNDVTIVTGSSSTVLRLPDRASVVMPFRVGLVAEIDGGDPVRTLLTANRRRQHERRVRRHGYTYRISTESSDFDRFFDQTYLPTMAARHGGRARTVGRAAAYRDLFCHGFLLEVQAGDRAVAGIICQIDAERRVIHSRLGGVVHGDLEHWRNGASQVADIFLYEWAAISGFTSVDLQGCEPFLRKGSLQGKIAIGGRLEVPADTSMQDWMVLAVHRDTRATRAFLCDNPVLSYDDAGRIGLTFFIDDSRGRPTDLHLPQRGVSFAKDIHINEFMRGLEPAGVGALFAPKIGRELAHGR